MGCSSLIPRTPHTPRGLLRNVLSVFPVMEEAAAKTETFSLSSVLSAQSSQQDLFEVLLPDVKTVLLGQRSTVLSYGVAESGKSFSLWGSNDDKGFVARALEYLHATCPADTRINLSFVGLSDTLAVDFLNSGNEINPIVFKQGIDGGNYISKTNVVNVSDFSESWELVKFGLEHASSDRHLILTITLHIPNVNISGEKDTLIGTLQVAEISLPGKLKLIDFVL